METAKLGLREDRVTCWYYSIVSLLFFSDVPRACV